MLIGNLASLAGGGMSLGSIAKGLGSVLSIGSSIKGLFGGNNKSGKLARALQDSQIQRMVADAKAAGIHPLYALGSSANYSPILNLNAGGDPLGAAGEAITRTVDRYSAEAQAKRNAGMESRLAMAQLGALQAQTHRDEAAAALHHAEAAKARQSLNWSPIGRGGNNAVYDPLLGLFETSPANVVAARPNQPDLQAGPSSPSGIEVVMPDGKRVKIPSQALMDSELPGIEYYARRFGKWAGGLIHQTGSRIRERIARKRHRTQQYRIKRGQVPPQHRR